MSRPRSPPSALRSRSRFAARTRQPRSCAHRSMRPRWRRLA